MKNKIIEATSERIRIDKYLVENNGLGLNRSQILKLFKQGKIKVGSQASKANYLLKIGDKIEIDNSANKITEPTKIKNYEKDLSKIIIDENKDFIVINKIAGILSHGTPTLREKTIADWLTKKYPATKMVGDDPTRPGIVHRLDRDVSGLMVVAKNQPSFESLKSQFKERQIEKHYVALAYGAFKEDFGKIDFQIDRSIQGYKMAALPKTVKGKINTLGRAAITEYKVIKKFVNYTLVDVIIKTGRTHQIRVHMAAIGHPLVGDNTYTVTKYKEKNKKFNLGRIFLVSTFLAFNDLKGERREYKIEIPGELKEFLKNIK